MERQERKDGVNGGTTTHTHVHIHMCMCSAIKIRYYKKYPVGSLMRRGFHVLFQPVRSWPQEGQDGRRNEPPWKGGGLFSSQKKGKWLYRDEI